MINMRTVLFLPGFPENLVSRDYAKTMKSIESRGYKVKYVPIDWSRTTISDWVEQLEAVYAQHEPKQTILAGFSFGAMTAFATAASHSPSELWLFSLSPYFAEDLNSKNMKQAWLDSIGVRRVRDFSKYNFAKLSKSIDCPVKLFAGQQEIDRWPIIGERVHDAHTTLRNSTLHIVEGAGHNVANPAYIDSIVKNI